MDKREEFEKWNNHREIIKNQQKIIDELKAENPDVDCPVCKGESEIVNAEWCVGTCAHCAGTGTVSIVKALRYENEQLKKVNKLLQESLDDDLIKTLKAMEA